MPSTTRLHDSRKTVLSIKVSLTLNYLKTRGIGGFKEGERERVLHASAITVDLRLAAETGLYCEARLRVMTQSTN